MADGDKCFVINGFYMAMREKFTLPDAKLMWFTVEWDAAALSWEDFRGKVLGATDPATAEAGSLRRAILENYKELGLTSEPNVGDNGVHASASPFEAMAERLNWLKAGECDADGFGKAMLEAGIAKELIMEYTKDPQVDIGDGKKGSLFDELEDMNATDCLKKAQKLAGVADKDAPELAKNAAFVFIKPHAANESVATLVKEEFGKKGIAVTGEGVLDGPTIDNDKLIDIHYGAIAAKASLMKPNELNPPEPKRDEFKEKFGITWQEALDTNQVFNAVDGCKQLSVSGAEMDGHWAKTKKAGQLVKFGGGFYCGLVNKNA